MCCGDGGWHESCYIFNMSGHIKYMWVGGGRHCGWQGQQWGEDQDVSLWLEFSPTRMWYAVVMLVDLKDCDSLNKSDNIKVICVGGWRHCGWQRQPEGGYHGGRWHHDVSLQSKSLGFYSPLLTSVSSFSLMLMSWTLVLSHNLKQSNTFKCSHHQYSLSHPHPHWLKNI